MYLCVQSCSNDFHYTRVKDVKYELITFGIVILFCLYFLTSSVLCNAILQYCNAASHVSYTWFYSKRLCHWIDKVLILQFDLYVLLGVILKICLIWLVRYFIMKENKTIWRLNKTENFCETLLWTNQNINYKVLRWLHNMNATLELTHKF